jgi:resolvase-like protein
VEVIDADRGPSGRSAQYRHGLQRLVADVALGQVGIVMGLAISRLARHHADCQQLLQLCGLHQTLIYDADAVYALTHLNDRLVLGLTGPLSEAELFPRRARLQGGLRHKASRGALATKRPVGFVSAPPGKVILDPAQQGQATMRWFCQTFRTLGASIAVGQDCNQQGRTLPTRPIKAPHRGALWWSALSSGAALRILHNPRYAGAFAYGRTRLSKSPSGGAAYTKRPRAVWHALVKEVHPGYSRGEACEAHQERWQGNLTHRSQPGAARQGHALLQGIVLCGHGGKNLATSYKSRAKGCVDPLSTCNRAQLADGGPVGTFIPGAEIDRMLSAVLLEQVTPLAMEAALAVQQAIVTRAQETDKL